MIQVKKRSKKSLLAIIVSFSVLLLLIVGLAIFSAVVKNTPAPEQQIGTSSTQYIYGPIDTSRIQSFGIDAHEGFIGARLVDGTYYLYYKDENGDQKLYYPSICASEPGFEYESLYSVTDDGMNVYKLSYVLYAIANANYDSKITLEVPDGAQSREEKLASYEEQLQAYGLDKAGREMVTFTYFTGETNSETGEKITKKITVYIGNKLVTGVGYYLKLSGDIFEAGASQDAADSTVYISSGAENYSYALEGFNNFVAPRVVMSGNLNNGDQNVTPQYTPSYRQWKNTVVDKAGETVKDKTKVVVTANIITSPYVSIENEAEQERMSVEENGYSSIFDRKTEIDLEYIADTAEYKSLINTLTSSKIGDYSASPIVSTVVFDRNVADEGKNYSYKIYEVESFVNADGSEHTTADGGRNIYVKVRYSCVADGSQIKHSGAEADMLHAVIDLTDTRVPENVRNILLGANIGVLTSPLEFDFTYTADNSAASVFEYRIKHISHIYDKSTYKEVYKISGSTIVLFTYEMVYNGKVVSTDTMTADLTLSGENDDPLEAGIRSTLLNLKIESNGLYEQDKVAYSSNRYHQMFKSFTTYEIKSVDYFVESEEIVSFKYTDTPDPYYGGDIHVNTLPNTHKYSSYPVDWRRCDRVIKVLSGTLLGTSSLGFEGLSGTRVVAAGLTPKNMADYGLYAYTISYTIPRFADSSNNYAGEDTVTFTIYISETNSEGKRYVGSDMYDLIVEMDGETLDFVEESFVDFWAKRDIMLVDQEYVNKMDVEFNMEGLRGKYSFNVAHPTVWIVTYKDGTRGRLNYDPGDLTDHPTIASKQEYIAATVYASVTGENLTETLLVQRLRATGQESLHIHALYNYRDDNPDNQAVGFDYLGDSSFKDLLLILYGTIFNGTLSEESAKKAMEKEAVMTLSYEVEGSGTFKTYRFYYTDDGRVAVSVSEGVSESCYFYISNYAFKTLIKAYSELVNGYPVSEKGGYAE